MNVASKWSITIAFAWMCLFLTSCGDATQRVQDKEPPRRATKKEKPVVLHILNMGEVPKEVMNELVQNMKNVYPHVIYEGKTAHVEDAYIKGSKKGKDRYWARTILIDMWNKHGNYAKHIRDKDIWLAVSDKEICNYKQGDHAIYGLSFTNTRLTVISYKHFEVTHRNTSKNIFKVAMHELGHSVGGLVTSQGNDNLHCPDKNCLMRDAKDRFPYESVSKLCPSCDKVMREKGFVTSNINTL